MKKFPGNDGGCVSIRSLRVEILMKKRPKAINQKYFDLIGLLRITSKKSNKIFT